MAVSKRRYVSWLLVGSVLLSSCYVSTHYSGWRYRGGRLTDDGVFSRPRYTAQFAEIPLHRSGTYSYSFSRFPADDAVVMMAIPGRPPETSITNLTTQVRLRVVDQDGRVHCDGTGSPRGKGDDQLVVTSSNGVVGLWHTRCARLQLQACNSCRLEVSVGPVDPATPDVSLVPTVQGGGLELP